MGNIPQIIEVKGTDPETAFQDTQREARHAYGHSGTTGTIADADGCIIISGPALLPWDCRRAAQQILRDGHAKPGGPAFILRIAEPEKKKTIRTVIDITELTPGQIDDAIDAAIRTKLPDDTWGIRSIEARDAAAEGDDRKGTLKKKITLTPSTGKRITRYTIKHSADGTTLAEKSTLPEARAWMKEALTAGAAKMECVAETRKETGPLLTGLATIVKQTVAVTAVIATTKPIDTGTYLVAGMYPTTD